MDRDAILDVMEKKANELFDANIKSGGEYTARGKRGAFTVQLRNARIGGQWDTSLRYFGTAFWTPDRHNNNPDGLLVNGGCNFEAGMLGKVAYSRRTGKNSGVHYYEALGGETFWPGAVVSEDGNCICAFGGLTAEDDVRIAETGIAEYEKRKNK